MLEIFISYARSTEHEARRIEEVLRAQGYEVWRDDRLPAHRAYSDVIEERLRTAKAVLVLWSGDAVRSHWVRAEAEIALAARTLVQATLDGAAPPMPFNQIQCADLSGWNGAPTALGWRQLVDGLEQLAAGSAPDEEGADAPTLRKVSLDDRPSIAVLPFANLCGDPEQDYFVDGMVVEIAEALSRIKSIIVIASGSTLSLKGKGLSPQEAARELGVGYVVEGSVRKAGGRVRIAVELIDAASGVQIWTQRFEDTLEDIFALQDKVALSVAAVIEPRVEKAEVLRASTRSTHDLHSYDLVLQAGAHVRSYSREGMEQALPLFERAILLDPNNSTALAWAAACNAEFVIYGWSDEPEANRRAGVALALDALKTHDEDALIFSNVALALSILDRDIDNAQVLVERAVSLNPGCSYAWLICGVVRLRAGRADPGIEAIEMSMRLDPIGPFQHAQRLQMGLGRFEQRRFKEAVAFCKEAIQFGWMGPAPHVLMIASYGHLGDIDAGREALAHHQALTPLTPEEFYHRAIDDPATLQVMVEGAAAVERGSPGAISPAVAHG